MDLTPAQQKENRQRLVEALRSGRFKQGFHRLSTIKKDGEIDHCCLGVACQVFIENGGVLSQTKLKDYIAYDDVASDMPEKVREYFGFRDRQGSFRNDGGYHSLVRENDAGQPFEVIADVIEEEPLALVAPNA